MQQSSESISRGQESSRAFARRTSTTDRSSQFSFGHADQMWRSARCRVFLCSNQSKCCLFRNDDAFVPRRRSTRKGSLSPRTNERRKDRAEWSQLLVADQCMWNDWWSFPIGIGCCTDSTNTLQGSMVSECSGEHVGRQSNHDYHSWGVVLFLRVKQAIRKRQKWFFRLSFGQMLFPSPRWVRQAFIYQSNSKWESIF